MHKLQVFQNKCLRVCHRLPIFTRVATLHEAARVPLLSSRLRALSSAYFNKAICFNDLINEEYIFYNNNLSVREGHLLSDRKSYRTVFGVLSGGKSTN